MTVIRKAPVYETATYKKTNHPVYETVTVGNELGANIQLQENPSYGSHVVVVNLDIAKLISLHWV